MTSASRWLLGVLAAGLLAVAGQTAHAPPLKVALPCDRPGLLAGAAFEPLQAALQARRPGVALIDFPTDDVASGMSVEALPERYATLLSVCDATATVCVIGGQRPADALAGFACWS